VSPSSGHLTITVLLAVALEPRHLASAQHRLQRAADRIDADAHVGKLVAVDVDADLGRVEAQVDLQVLHARILPHLVQEPVDGALELGIRNLRHHDEFDRRRPE
jgi:hypothetical protein